jgi:hypothetical protein
VVNSANSSCNAALESPRIQLQTEPLGENEGTHRPPAFPARSEVPAITVVGSKRASAATSECVVARLLSPTMGRRMKH